jgi:hypothetical protein
VKIAIRNLTACKRTLSVGDYTQNPRGGELKGVLTYLIALLVFQNFNMVFRSGLGGRNGAPLICNVRWPGGN